MDPTTSYVLLVGLFLVYVAVMFGLVLLRHYF